MTELAALVGAITFLILVVGGFVVLYYPPKLLKKFKFKDLEGEFDTERHPMENASPPAPVAESTGTAEEPAKPSDEDGPPITVDQGFEEFRELFELFNQGKYREGMKLLEQRTSDGPPEAKARARAYWGLFAQKSGASDAFADLQQVAGEFPSEVHVQLSYAQALVLIEDFGEAIRVAHAALDQDVIDPETRISLVTFLAEALARSNRHREALPLLTNESQSASLSPDQKARLYRTLSELYRKMTPANQSASAALQELAMRLTPGNVDARFQLAYKYGSEAPQLALHHYRKILDQAPDHSYSLNNAGVAAQALSLPIKATQFYQRAEAKDNTLASANIAYKLLEAGFTTEATAILDAARTKQDVHQNVAISGGRIASDELDENRRLDNVVVETEKFVAWRIKHAEALLGPSPSLDDVLGDYEVLSLESVDGRIIGHFKDRTDDAELQGRLEGRALSFSWRTLHDAAYLRRAGHGLILLLADGMLEGYRYPGEERTLDLTTDEFTFWSLRTLIDIKLPTSSGE